MEIKIKTEGVADGDSITNAVRRALKTDESGAGYFDVRSIKQAQLESLSRLVREELEWRAEPNPERSH